MERRRFSQAMASEWQTAFVVSHKMPWCALLTAVKNYNKSLEKLQDFFFKTEIKTKTFIFVLEAPRDQDPGGLEDYITAAMTNTETTTKQLQRGIPGPDVIPTVIGRNVTTTVPSRQRSFAKNCTA